MRLSLCGYPGELGAAGVELGTYLPQGDMARFMAEHLAGRARKGKGDSVGC